MDFVPIPLMPLEEFYYSEHEIDDYERLLIATAASYVGYQALLAPYVSESVGLMLMRSMYVTVPGLAATIMLISADIEMDQIQTIAKQESTPSWWKILTLSGI